MPFVAVIPAITERSRSRLVLAIGAIVAYLPIIFSSPGAVGADTKTYLYIDPGKLLSGADTLWDSDVALGTVTHQSIGYLWPMGPFYWVLDTLGSPDWFAQRLWLGSLLFAAGAGVWFLLRTLDWAGHGMLVAMLAYELSPYLLDYSARISAVLLPWAGLPWMIALTIRAARSGGWRHPALFALLVVTIGSVNATSLLMVGVAPVLWLFHAALAERSVSPMNAVKAALRIAALTLLTSAWWIAGLVLQGNYSLPVTRYTEPYEAVADSSTAPEILRGLGYWFFYGNDKFGQWIQPSIEYTQGVWLLFLTFGLVVLALLAAGVVRWQHRAYFLLLLVVGALMGVASHPFDSPSVLGSLFKDFTRTDAGLALRSTPRAVPMVVLATAVLLGSLVRALHERWGDRTRPFAALVLAAIVLANPAMWRIRMIEEHLQRDEELPEYWIEATQRLDELDDGSRVWELPGSDFASYRWGNTVDPITPGLMDRGYVARELVPFGSAQSAALVTAFDRRLQEGSLDADALIPIARLMSVGDVVHRADLTFERFRTPRPIPTNNLLENIPGLGEGEGFGSPIPNLAGPQQTMLDEIFLATDPALPDPSPVVRYAVPEPLEVIRLKPVDASTVLVGDAEGLVDAAGAGLLDLDRSVFFGADLITDPDLAAIVLAEPAEIVITDTNRRRARRWGTLRENVGATEQAGEEPLRFDPTDNRLNIFPAVEQTPGLDPDDTRTISIQQGGFSIVASAYGNPVTYTLDDRAVFAVDGDMATAWTVAAFAEARGERLLFTYPEPVTLDQVSLAQPLVAANRRITEVAVRADGREVTRTAIRPRADTIAFTPTEATVWEIELTDLDLPRRAIYPGVSPVGFAEVIWGGSDPVVEWIRTPRALLDQLGRSLEAHSLSVVLTRERSDPREPVRGEPEIAMRRIVPLPTDRTFTVDGTARLSPYAASTVVDAAIGRVEASGIELTSSGSLPGDLASLPSAALDGDGATAWTGVFGPQAGQHWQASTPSDTSFNQLKIEVVADEVHSVPTAIRVWVNGTDAGVHPTGLDLAEAPRGTTKRITLPVEATAATEVRLEMVEVAERITRDWYSNSAVAMPLAIAEIEFGLAPVQTTERVDTGCMSGVLDIAGRDVPLKIEGTVAAALAGNELAVSSCGDVTVAAGDVEVVVHPVEQASAQRRAFDIDQLVLTSPRDLTPPPELAPITVERIDDVTYTVGVPGATSDRWLVLGQSFNEGWHAFVDGDDIGEQVVIDGFANAWLLPAGDTVTVELHWTPQGLVDRMIQLSILGVLLCIVVAWRGRGQSRQADAPRADGPRQPTMGRLPWLASTTRPTSPRLTLAASTVVLALSALILPSWVWLAVPLALGTAIVARVARPAGIATIAASGVFGVTALLIMIEQRRFRNPPDFGWPQQYDELHILGMVTILLVAVEYTRAVIRPER